MDHPRLVCGLQRLRDLLRDRQRLIQRDRPLRDPVSEGGPFDQLQHERLDALRLLQPVDAPDVRMVERGEDLGFPLEAGQAVGVRRERLGQHLERHVAVEFRVAGLPDLAHAAFTDLGGDGVRADGSAG